MDWRCGSKKKEQAKNRVTDLEDIVELDQSDKDKNNKKIWIDYAKPLEHDQNTKPMNHGFRRRGTTWILNIQNKEYLLKATREKQQVSNPTKKQVSQQRL
jgi:hypothetical protein